MRTTSIIAAITMAFAASAAAAEDKSPVATTPLEKLRLEALQISVTKIEDKEKGIDADKYAGLDACASNGLQNCKSEPPCDALGQRANGNNCVLVWKRVDGKPDALAWVEQGEASSHRLPVLGADGKLY
ncbi:hypothetical protein OIU34_16760 [Pararhizobium sp. BT-229]|uniref:hypothetical protein n=1 Tax=Pararhizobium sp. BT-229 TaxID=2986923 RepID=UPI0021F70AD7|nr:hypothetical protein [Pararhizobium sp. BT-229]MCV9963556.1 hypothetical protein [Pararhizobium sp. BT-229]